MLWRELAAAVIGSLAAAVSAAAFDPATEARNVSKTTERAAIYSSPEGQLLLRRVGLSNALASLRAQTADPERSFSANLCARGEDGCAGDPRLYNWGPKGYGLVEPVLWTARNGATISGHVWAARAGPAQRPGVVITNGSVQADEQMYWYAAQALAKAGYVVLTWDPQGQGQSDVAGEGPGANEGVPAQSDGRPFYDGTVDALDFFLSTPDRPFTPRPSCETGTSHAPKQQRRVAAGLNAAHNPFSDLLDRGRIGLAGHSSGAAGVSYGPRSRSRTAGRASTPVSSSSAVERTTSSASSPTRPSAPPCAAPTWPPGTRPPGSTGTSRATPAPTRAC